MKSLSLCNNKKRKSKNLNNKEEMKKTKELEIEAIENVERVLDNIFSDEKVHPKLTKIKKSNDLLLIEPHKIPPILFVNSHLVDENELLQKSRFVNNPEHVQPPMTIGNQIDRMTLNKLKGTFYELITSQNGSRYMQKVYLNIEPDILEEIFLELLPKISKLMIDPYANYFCQKLYSVLNDENKMKFLYSLVPEIELISNSKIGTYPLQSVIEQLKTDKEQTIIMNALSGKVLSLCQNSQGVHVIEKIIVCFKEILIEEIYTTIIANFLLLATNSIGLFVCKKLISSAKNPNHLIQIRDLICNNSMMLIHNQYGNYTIQVAIESWPAEFTQPLIRSLFPFFISLSCQKYASNVIEKCLEKSKETILIEFIDELGKNSNIITLLTNSFGNFVLQTAIKLSKGKNKIRIVNYIKKNLDKINDKKIVKKWKEIISLSSHLTFQNNFPANTNSHSTLNKSYEKKKSINSEKDKLNISTSSNKSNKSGYSFKSTGDVDYNYTNQWAFNNSFLYPVSNNNSPRTPVNNVYNSFSGYQQNFLMINYPQFKPQNSINTVGYTIF